VFSLKVRIDKNKEQFFLNLHLIIKFKKIPFVCVCVFQGIGLLTNLVENCDTNCERLIQTKCCAPYDCHYAYLSDNIDCLEALGMVSYAPENLAGWLMK